MRADTICHVRLQYRDSFGKFIHAVLFATFAAPTSLIEKPTQAAVNSTEEYVEKVAERMQLAYSAVRQGLKASFERCKRRYDAVSYTHLTLPTILRV